MKIKDIYSLSKANIQGSKNTNTITILICLLVISVTIISSYSVVVTKAVDMYNEQYMTRAFPFGPPVTQEAIEAISSIDHVEAVDSAFGILYPTCLCTVLNEEVFGLTEKTDAESRLYIRSLFDSEKKSVVKGKTLDNAPVFSCIVPNRFYPFSDASSKDFKNLDYIDGRTLIGKTIIVQPGFDGDMDLTYWTYTDEDNCESVLTSVASAEFELEVVGTYFCGYSTSGDFRDVFVSKETELLMTERILEAANIDLSSDDSGITQWYNNPSLHNYVVLLDDYSNKSDVLYEIEQMGYRVTSLPLRQQDDTMNIVSSLFRFVGTFLSVAVVIVSAVLLIQYATNAIRERRGYIGLMKAIGYKNRQIGLLLCFEQVYLSLRAALLGAVISIMVTFFINLYFEYGSFYRTQYIMDWRVFFGFLLVSSLIVTIIPLVTELLLIGKLTKIQPKDAMSAK